MAGDFDLAEQNLVITECKQCDATVSGRPSAGRVTLTCGTCGAEDVRELAPERAVGPLEAAYRGKPRGARGYALPMDLGVPPPGWTARPKPAAVREAWVKHKREALPEDAGERGEREHLLTWLAVTCAGQYVVSRDYLKARALLDAALAVLRVPAYRAMILARLARLAALANGVDLARDWLAQVPAGVKAPEVDTDIRVAEAFIARASGDPREVLRAVGNAEADSNAGPTRWLAHALRVDAHEQLGEKAIAVGLWTKGAVQSRKSGQAFGSYAGVYGLAPATRRTALYRGLYALGILALMLVGVVTAFGGLGHDGRVPGAAILEIAVALVAAIILRVTRRG